MPRPFLVLLPILPLLAAAGRAEEAAPAETRPFAMGFNPWPHDATAEGAEWMYGAINEKGDVISHHLEEGVPWPEAAADKPFAADYENALQLKLKKTGAGKKILLSLNPINTGRNGLAWYRGSAINMPQPAPWDKAGLDSPEVRAAWLKYVRRMVAMFKPDWLAIGIEVNLLARNAPALWPKYVELHRFTYRELKKTNPDLPVLASFDSNALLEGYSRDDDPAVQKRAFADLLPSLDMVGISLHPFLSTVHLAEKIPDDMFDRIFALTDKPIGITESSYCAQPWSLAVNGTTVRFSGSAEKQRAFVARMLEAAGRHRAPFVVLFAIRDYDALWEAIGKSEQALPWRDTGLYDEAGKPRPALEVWESYLRKARK